MATRAEPVRSRCGAKRIRTLRNQLSWIRQRRVRIGNDPDHSQENVRQSRTRQPDFQRLKAGNRRCLNDFPNLILHDRFENLPAIFLPFEQSFAELYELIGADIAGQWRLIWIDHSLNDGGTVVR